MKREIVGWKKLAHDHVLPFVGVSEEIFQDTMATAVWWMKGGNVQQYILSQREQGKLTGDGFVVAVNQWVCTGRRQVMCSNRTEHSSASNQLLETSRGLEYLHGKGVVHGNLHAGNVLIDDSGCVRLSDFGLSKLIEDAPSGLSTSRMGVPASRSM